MKPLYKNEATRVRTRELTDHFRTFVDGPTRDHMVETGHGRTYVLEAGDPALRTVVVLHGGMTNHAFILFFLRELVGRYHIVCPDLPGHAGLSTEQRIDPRGDDYGHWMLEVLDGLDVASADFVGTSYGGFVTNRVIALAPQRVRSAVLLVPAGIVGMPMLKLMRHMVVWQLLYAVTGAESFFRRIMDALFTDYEVDEVTEFFRLALTGMNIDTRPMKTSSLAECEAFEAPMLVIGAEEDVIFDPVQLGARVSELYPHAKYEVLAGSKHSPSLREPELLALNARVIAFLEQA